MEAQRTSFLIWTGLMALMSSFMLASSSFWGWEIRPTTIWMRGAFFSVLRVTAAVENFLTASSGLSVRVPFLGLGMRPLGPKIRARGRILGMRVGVATRMSKSILPAWISLMSLSLAMATFLDLVFRWGKLISPTLPGVRVVLIWASILPSNLERDVSLTS